MEDVPQVTTAQIEHWIRNCGSERDALNIALAKLELARFKLSQLQDAVDYSDCPKCKGITIKGWRCLNCGFDDSQ